MKNNWLLFLTYFIVSPISINAQLDKFSEVVVQEKVEEIFSSNILPKMELQNSYAEPTTQKIYSTHELGQDYTDIDSLQGIWKGKMYMIEKSHVKEYELDSLGNETEILKKINTINSRSHLVSNTTMEIKEWFAKLNIYGTELSYKIQINGGGEVKLAPFEDENLGVRYYRSIDIRSNAITLIYFEFPSDLFWIEFIKEKP